MSHIVPCPNPPGGHIVCDDHQLGVCSIQNGERVGGCVGIPENLIKIEGRQERNIGIANWVLSLVLVQSRSFDQAIEDHAIEVLRSGEYRRPDGHMIRFALPLDIDLDNLQGVAARAY